MITACPLCCSLPLTHGKYALLDPCHWVSLERKGWRAKKSRGGWYAYKITRVNGKNCYTYLHRHVAKTPTGKVTHHKNGFTLDDRETNLLNLKESEHKDLHRMLRIGKRRIRKTG